MKKLPVTTTRVTLHIIYWLAFSILCPWIFTLFYYPEFLFEKFKLQFSSLLLGYTYLIPTTYFITYYLIPKLLLKRKFILFSSILFTILVSLALLDDITNIQLFIPKHIPDRLEAFKNKAFTFNHLIIVGVLLYLQLISFLSLKFLKEYVSNSFEKANLKQKIFDTELKTLGNQLQPHFLFNTLNNIYSLSIDSSNPIVPESIERISSILRYTLYECNNNLTHISKEIKVIKDYIELERIRYSNITIDVSFPDTHENVYVIPLLLFTFVENAFKHGTSKAEKNKWIKIDLQTNDSILYFKISNSKNPNYSSEDHKYRIGIGLANAKKRLDLFYGDKNYSLIKEDKANVFEIKLKIDLKHKN
ncbi:MAG: histidine kinase [Bacteroidales bacterium]|nr:histidine kinase [Bacteroidales bacterium]